VNATVAAVKVEYLRGLQEYLADGQESALQQAYELGRRVMADGLGVVEMATIHHEALATVTAGMVPSDEVLRTIKAAGEFLAESLSPFEMTHRGFREANLALRQSEERYRSLVDNAKDVIYTLSPDGTVTSLNPCFESMTGWLCSDWLGQPFGPLVHPDDLPLAGEIFHRVLQGDTPPISELRIRMKSGEHFHGEFTKTPLIKEGEIIGILGIGRDITDRKRAEEALRRLNLTLEDEAKRIAHALHDEAGQLLASVHIALDVLASELPATAQKQLATLRDLLAQTEEQLRRLSHELRPTILDNLGLRPALEFLAQGVSHRTGLSITVEGETKGRLSSSVELALYRIVQAALNNATKHARATGVTVQLQREALRMRCTVKDDGTGFDLASVLARHKDQGLGLLGIRERVTALGGSLQIDSGPGRGTTIRVEIPL
jgi:two-component system, NarL family, sensor histidine kinase UhpB